MDDEPMWAADRVDATTLGSEITILKTANKLAIKGNHLTLVKGNQFDGRTKTDPHKHIHEFLRIYDMFKYRDTKNEAVHLMIFFPPALFDRLLEEIRAFSQHENESLTDACLRMKEMLRNCHGHNLSKGNFIKIFYHGLSKITQEVLNAAAGGIFLYKTYNQAYQLLEDKVLLKLNWAKNQTTKSSLKKTVSFADEGNIHGSQNPTRKSSQNHQASIQNLETKFDRLADEQSGRLSGSLPINTQPNPKGHSSKSCQLSQARNKHVNVVLTRSGKFYNPPVYPNDQQENSEIPVNLDSDDEDDKPTPQPKTQNPKPAKETPLPKPHRPKILIDVIDEILEEYFDALLEEGNKILHSIKGTLFEEEIFAEFDEFMAMTTDENLDSDSDIEEPPFKKITINTNYKIKTSLKKPPTDLELKCLLDNLEYVFLEEPFFLPIIISSQLSKEKKNKLISVDKNISKPLLSKQHIFLVRVGNIPQCDQRISRSIRGGFLRLQKLFRNMPKQP
nr:reverse transcriptase domain-containing protein [Tanacetum cinerariifolium]